MRVSATHIVLETMGPTRPASFSFRKVYELSDGEYVVEIDGELKWLHPDSFAKWSDNYQDYMNGLIK